MGKINDEFILTYFFGKNKNRLNKSLLINIPNEIIEYLNKRYSDSTCVLETLERIKKNIDIHPLCEGCGKPVKYVGSTRMFLKTCGCKDCEKIVNTKHYKETNIKKYGVDNPAKSEIIKEKTKITNIERYGCKCTLQNKEIKKKIKQTNIKKYGAEYAQSSSVIKEKMSKSNKEFWNTVNKEEFINKVQEKIQKTNIEKYGVSNPMKVKEIHDKIIPKVLEAKRKNGTFNKSKEEDKSFILLKEKYSNIIRQYKSKEYPFECDFYIPSLNLYIECNYFWMHGLKPYTGTEEDNIKLNNWKCHNTKIYNNAINTWTIRDVNKRNTAKENNLNWIEFFNISELKEWIDKN